MNKLIRAKICIETEIVVSVEDLNANLENEVYKTYKIYQDDILFDARLSNEIKIKNIGIINNSGDLPQSWTIGCIPFFPSKSKSDMIIEGYLK